MKTHGGMSHYLKCNVLFKIKLTPDWCMISMLAHRFKYNSTQELLLIDL